MISYPLNITTPREKLAELLPLHERARLFFNSVGTAAPLYPAKWKNFVRLWEAIARQVSQEIAIQRASILLSTPGILSPDRLEHINAYRGRLAFLSDIRFYQGSSRCRLPALDLLEGLLRNGLGALLEDTVPPDPTEDFTTYTETDPGAVITVAAAQITHNGTINAGARVHKDYGVGHFGNTWTHLFDFQLISQSGSTPNPAFHLLANGVANRNQNPEIYAPDIYGAKIYLGQYTGTYNDVQIGTFGTSPFSLSTWYYAKHQRTSSTSHTLYVYSDAARTTQVTGSPWTLTLSTALYRYMYGFQAGGAGSANMLSANLDLQEAVVAALPSGSYGGMF